MASLNDSRIKGIAQAELGGTGLYLLPVLRQDPDQGVPSKFMVDISGWKQHNRYAVRQTDYGEGSASAPGFRPASLVP